MAGYSQHVMGCSSICPAVPLPVPGLAPAPRAYLLPDHSQGSWSP